MRYQWQVETAPGSGLFTHIPFATTPTLVTTPVAASQDGLGFRVLVSVDRQPPLISPVVRLAVTPDEHGPELVEGLVTRRLREVQITFNEPVLASSVRVASNYTIPGATVTNVLVDATGRRALLVLDTFLPPGTSQELTVSNAADLAGHPLEPNPTTLTVHAPALAAGYALRELYYGIPGNSVTQLINSPFYPRFPNDTLYVDALEGRNDILWEYGTRLSGYIVPPVTGGYHFWICSDDQSQLWLSPDEDPARAALVCREPQFPCGGVEDTVVKGFEPDAYVLTVHLAFPAKNGPRRTCNGAPRPGLPGLTSGSLRRRPNQRCGHLHG